MKVLAFGASSSKSSINQRFASYVSKQLKNAEVEEITLSDYEAPMYSVDREKDNGIPDQIERFIEKLENSELIIVSMAEHNGSYTAAFKNTFDWSSRKKLKMFEGKKMIVLSTSPGPGGGRFVLEHALVRFPRHGAEIIGSLSLPQFDMNFSEQSGISLEEKARELEELIRKVHDTFS